MSVNCRRNREQHDHFGSQDRSRAIGHGELLRGPAGECSAHYLSPAMIAMLLSFALAVGIGFSIGLGKWPFVIVDGRGAPGTSSGR